jgi:predicted AAA+ superfamily ATPase
MAQIVKRDLSSKLAKWKSQSDRKPLVLQGARQVGKTWLMKEFGKKHYDDMVYISFEEKTPASRVFASTQNAQTIIDQLQIARNKVIDPQKCLIVLDEIQESANALGALKYFAESAPEYHVMAAGSLLGTYLAKPVSYPVGKVNLFNMFPVTFGEFLRASHEGLYEYYTNIAHEKDFVPAFHDEMLRYYREYLIVGGMPECVKGWLDKRDPADVLDKQRELVTLYENDFTKHNGAVNAARILQVFRSIPTQLAKESNEKFVYGAVRQGGRARDFEDAIEWLKSAGIVNQVFNVSSSQVPLRPYELLNHFKLYLFDTGLLKYVANVQNNQIIFNDDFSFKGQLNENYVLQQLIPQMLFPPNYYARSNEFEIDFLLQKDERVIPVEVKSATGKRATSFKRYIEKYRPETAFRFNTNGYVKDGNITNIPLYLVGRVMELLV